MDANKVHYNEEQVADTSPARSNPPPYSEAPQSGPYGPPTSGLYAPNMIHATPVGLVGPNVGMVGSNVGMIGTNVGMVGTNIGMVGTNVGMVGTGMVPFVVTQHISPKPTRLTCKSCNSEILTRVESKASFKTHFVAALLCLMGCWCCVCIPYCTDSCMNNDHYCPNCNIYIGSYVI